MKRVLFTTNIPSPYRVNFFNLLAEKIDLTVWYFWEKGIENLPWNINQNQHKYKYKVFKEINIGVIRINPELIKALKIQKFDFVIVGGYSLISEVFLIEYLRISKKPFVLNTDGGFVNNKNVFVEKLKKHLISSATYWLSSGKKATETLIYYGAVSSRITNYNFSSVRDKDVLNELISQTEKENYRKKLELPLDKKIIISVGRYIESKGFDRILNTASQLKRKKYLFILIGKGLLKENYCNTIKQKHLDNVLILDFLEKEKLYQYYKASDLYVFPTKLDVWGLVLNEAIACGLPAISSNRAGSAYDLIDGNGEMFDNDGETLSEQIVSVLECVNYKELSERSLSIAKQYTIEKMVEKHLQLFEKMENEYDS